MIINIDADLNNADWLRQEWELPPYKSEEFMEWLDDSGMTLEDFQELPLYQRAVEDGLIVDDEWAGKSTTDPLGRLVRRARDR